MGIFSLGTGICKKMKRSAFSRDDPGLAQWIKSLIGVSLAMNEQMAAICANSILQDGIFRLNPEVGESIDGFDASPQNIRTITDIAMSVDIQPAIAWLSEWWMPDVQGPRLNGNFAVV